MAIEIEAKFKVSDHESIRQRIRSIGGEHLGDVFETNTFFDSPDRTLQTSDSGLRLRQVKNLHGPRGQGSGRTSYVLTFKGPVQPGALKQRQELETTVADGAAVAAILERLGYSETLLFEKKRQSWKVKECTVELDELPELGTYVEVEGPSESAVVDVMRALGFEHTPLIVGSYASLLALHLHTAGRAGNAIRF